MKGCWRLWGARVYGVAEAKGIGGEMNDNYEYPTEAELETIREWDLLKKPVAGLVEYVRDLWWAPDWGFHLKGKRVLLLQLHTGGWSGNEDIIAALKQNVIFWMMCWRKSTVGGHFWFRIRVPLFKAAST